MGFCLLNPLAVKIGVGWLPSRTINESWLMRICQTLMKTWSQYVLICFTCWIVPRIHLLYNFIPTQDQKKNPLLCFRLFFSKIVFPVLSFSCVTRSFILLNFICLHLFLTSGWSPLAPWPCAPAAEIWNPVLRWCSRCFAWYLHGSGCTSPVATTQHFSVIFS